MSAVRVVCVGFLLLGLAALPSGVRPARASARTTPVGASSPALRSLSDPVGTTAATATAANVVPPRIKHVFVIVYENKTFNATWGSDSKAPYLAKRLRSKGVLLKSYYGIGHHSLPNYIAMISGQGPDPDTQADCTTYSDFQRTGTHRPGQAVGNGCVYPADVPTLTQQLDRHGLTWRGYMQQMGTRCRHPQLNTHDDTQSAKVGDMYAARHDPFVYFHSIIDRGRYCKRHVVDLKRLPSDLQHVRTTRNLTFITPDLCRDGHDSPCVDGKPGGLVSFNRFLKHWVPKIRHSRAFRRNGLLVIVADEGDSSGTTSCCGEGPMPNADLPGIDTMGGGLIGALLISPRWIKPGSTSTRAYNHFSLLRSIEDLWGLRRLGYARIKKQRSFGADVYNR